MEEKWLRVLGARLERLIGRERNECTCQLIGATWRSSVIRKRPPSGGNCHLNLVPFFWEIGLKMGGNWVI